MNIPKRFQEPGLRFIPIEKGSKVSKNNWKILNYPIDAINCTINSNYAVVLGHGHLICIDIDDSAIFKENVLFSSQQTLIIETGKGFHLYFKTKKEFDQSYYASNIGEFRARDCYTMIPPSIHPSGREYKVFRDLPIKWVSDEEVTEFLKFFQKSKSIGVPIQRSTKSGGTKSGVDRSAVDFGFCCTLLRDGKEKEDIFRIIDKCGSDKWKSGTVRYKEITYNNASMIAGGLR